MTRFRSGTGRPDRCRHELRPRWQVAAALAATVAIAAACGSSATGSPAKTTAPTASTRPTVATTTPAASPAPSVGAPVRTSLTVVACPTTRGVPGTPPARFPATISVPLPASLGQRLAYYSDDSRSLAPVMGPSGWDCGVGVGADGSTVVAVFPPAEASSFPAGNLFPRPFTGSTDQAVVAYTPSACQDCVYGLVCPLIPTADAQLGYSQPCPTPPAAERITWLSGSASIPVGPTSVDRISFEDPPGVVGDGNPSGGPYPANGVINYRYGPEGSAASLTCTLPTNEHQLCTEILNDFDQRNWPSAPAS